VCLAYLQHFGADSQAVVQHRRFRRILDRKASAALFELLENPPRRFRAAIVAGALRHLLRLNCPGKGRVYLNIGHTGLDTDGFRDWVREADVRPVYFVHDLIPITHPESCRDGEDVRHRRRMRTVLETGHGVIANSQATIDELTRFAHSEQLPTPLSMAAWLGTTPLKSAPAPEASVGRPYFVALGTIEARKNHLLLLNVWRQLIRRLGERAPRLLIIGRRGWKAGEVFEALDKDETLRGHVVEINDCTDEELARHLGSARALLFPSMAEGFGLPLVEALGAGVPVIASDLPVFREVGQGVPMLITGGEETWEDSILEFLRPGSAAREAQLRRMRRFRAPDWQSHFQAVERWLSTLRQGQDARSSNRRAR
jgi:glycosyltransferase involved in cell wall biosynthesis